MARFLDKTLLTYDDVVIVPQTSDTKSRGDIYKNIHRLPLIISANMESVTDLNLVNAMEKVSQIGVLPRNYSLPTNNARYISVGLDLMVNLLGQKYSLYTYLRLNRTKLFIFLEVANAANTNVLGALKEILSLIKDAGVEAITKVIVGNFAYAETLEPFLCQEIVNSGLLYGFKIGLGPGSACTTRVKTGVGYPQFSAVLECAQLISSCWWTNRLKIIADGGIRQPGDFCKAIGAGAHHVMLGRVLAESKESPGWETYYTLSTNETHWRKTMAGSASFTDEFQEGISFPIIRDKEPEPVAKIVKEYMEGLASCMSYSGGARTIKEFQERCIFARVNHSTLAESHPRPQ